MLVAYIVKSGMAVNVSIDDPLMQFSWLGYGVVIALYTVVVFRGDLSREGPFIFSQENARTPFAILCIHGAFLALICLAAQMIPAILPLLPLWMTERIHARSINLTSVDALSILAVIIMSQIERRWLFVGTRTASSGTENDVTQPSVPKRK